MPADVFPSAPQVLEEPAVPAQRLAADEALSEAEASDACCPVRERWQIALDERQGRRDPTSVGTRRRAEVIPMKKRQVLPLVAGLLVVLLGLGAFVQATATSYRDLDAQLRAAGAIVTEQGAIAGNIAGPELSTPLLRGNGRIFAVNGEPVEVYAESTAVVAAADAARISPDGSTFSAGVGPLGGSVAAVDWVTTPPFYHGVSPWSADRTGPRPGHRHAPGCHHGADSAPWTAGRRGNRLRGKWHVQHASMQGAGHLSA